MIVPVNARRELREFNPPLLAPRSISRIVNGLGAVSTAERYAKFYGVRSPRGMGDISSQQINAIASTGASTTVGILTALGTIGGPVGAAIGGLIAVGSLIANMFHGCGQTCVAATQDANKAAQLLQQNLDNYMNAPVHYESLQQAALNNVDTLFNALRQACSDPSLGAAGQRCISERLVRGGTAPWCPNPGNTGCDWYVQYRDPIANDPKVVPDPTAAASVSNAVSNAVSSVTGGTFDISKFLLPGGLVLGGLILMSLGGSSK